MTPTQVLSCKYRESVKNTYFEEHLRTAAFEEVTHSLIVFSMTKNMFEDCKKYLYVNDK